MSFLEFTEFSVNLATGAARPVLAEVSLHVARGEVVGLVGESGSGKSTTAKAALGLVPPGATVSGTVAVDGESVFDLDADAVRRLRTVTAAMVFQDARTALNPVRRVGDFLTEQLEQVGWTRRAATRRMLELLEAVRIPDPERRLRQFPHELSGGMLQRVSVAAALAMEPALLLADEPTSALDVSTQAETMALLGRLQREHRFAMLFITHDLHLATAVCDRVYVMYAGRIVEEQPGATLLARPRHPYTRGLLDSAPALEGTRRLVPVPGRPLSLDEAVTGCPFVARCAHAEPECAQWQPTMTAVGEHASAACRRLAEVDSMPAEAAHTAERGAR